MSNAKPQTPVREPFRPSQAGDYRCPRCGERLSQPDGYDCPKGRA